MWDSLLFATLLHAICYLFSVTCYLLHFTCYFLHSTCYVMLPIVKTCYHLQKIVSFHSCSATRSCFLSDYSTKTSYGTGVISKEFSPKIKMFLEKWMFFYNFLVLIQIKRFLPVKCMNKLLKKMSENMWKCGGEIGI